MRQKKIELTEEEIKRLEAQVKNSPKSYERDRAKSILLLHKGMLIKEIVKVIDVHRNTIGRWQKEWREQSKISMKSGRGAVPKLTEEMRVDLEKFLKENPYSVTKAHKMIMAKYGISLHRSTVAHHIKKVQIQKS